ncbi:MAG: hypothetical protein JW774_00485 [Candidatus Aureabacteria bacterium]|nr:hypothetical protein [Candidatus Auribacterota bacterium]
MKSYLFLLKVLVVLLVYGNCTVFAGEPKEQYFGVGSRVWITNWNFIEWVNDGVKPVYFGFIDYGWSKWALSAAYGEGSKDEDKAQVVKLSIGRGLGEMTIGGQYIGDVAIGSGYHYIDMSQDVFDGLEEENRFHGIDLFGSIQRSLGDSGFSVKLSATYSVFKTKVIDEYAVENTSDFNTWRGGMEGGISYNRKNLFIEAGYRAMYMLYGFYAGLGFYW